MTSNINQETVWGPQGSPYVIQSTIYVNAKLTMLPGTVVKLAGDSTSLVIQDAAQLLVLGSRDGRVIFTSYKDDTVMGDTNGDGSASVPAPGDWAGVRVTSVYGAALASQMTPPSVIDHADLRFGGAGYGSCNYAEVKISYRPNFVMANSTVTKSANAGFISVQNSTDGGYFGLYSNVFDQNGSDICVFDGRGDIAGNVLGRTVTDEAGGVRGSAYVSYPHKVRFMFNLAYSWVTVAGAYSPASAPTRTDADVRFNEFVGGAGNYYPPSQDLSDWSDNWWSLNVNDPTQLPTCATPTEATAHKPQLVIDLNQPCQQSGYYKVTGIKGGFGPGLSSPPQTLPASIAEAAAPSFGPVNTYSGALTYSATDLSIEDAGKQVAATRTYRSDRLSDTDTGIGWSSAYSESLSTVGGSNLLSLSDGSQLPFNIDPSAGYTPAPGVSADFATSASGTTITSNGQTGYDFNTAGELTGVSLGDPGHRVQVDRSAGKVSKLTGVSGRSITYNRASGRLTGFADSGLRTVGMSYTGDRLMSVTGVDGKAESYEYDSAGRLTKVSSALGVVRMAAGYDGQGRVSWIEQAGSGRATIAYDTANHRSTVTLANGDVITQEYDDLGRMVSETRGSSSRRVIYDGTGGVAATIDGVPDGPMTGYTPQARLAFTDLKGNRVFSVDPVGQVERTTFNSKNMPLVTTQNDGTTITRTYDANGRLDTVTDPAGKVSHYTFNGRGQPLSVTDPIGRVQSLTYESDGDAATSTSELGATTTFENDGLGRPTAMTDALNHRSEVTYTSWGAIDTQTAPLGGVTRYAYDDDRRQTSITDPTGVKTTYEYDTAGRLGASLDTLNHRTTIEYDIVGRVWKVTTPRGGLFQRTYTPEGWLKTSTDQLNVTTTAFYDPAGRGYRVVDALNQVQQGKFDAAGRIVEAWGPDGSHTTLTYDVMGRPISRVTPRGYTWKTGYDARGSVTSITDPLNRVTSTSYDDIGRTTSTTDGMGVVTSIVYDDSLRKVTTSDSLGTISVVRLDVLGRTESTTDAVGTTASYEYDADGNPITTTTPLGISHQEFDLAGRLTANIDPVGRRLSTSYDSVGKPHIRTYPDLTTEQFAYDDEGNLVDRTDQTGAIWHNEYDLAGHPTIARDPLNHESHTEYDALGRVKKYTDETGVVTNTAYDPLGRPAVRWDVSGASWVTSYDLDGNVAGAVDPTGVTRTYTYDKAGQLTTEKWGTVTYSYTYDNVGRRLTKSDPYLSTYTYDIRGRVKSVKDALNNLTGYEYDGMGRPTKETSPSGYEKIWTYDELGNIKTARDPLGNTSRYDYYADGKLQTLTLPRGGQYTYAYDTAGRLDTETDPLNKVTSYDYDNEGRQTLAVYPSGRQISSSYDVAGQRTHTSSSGVTRDFGYDDAGRLTSAKVAGDLSRDLTFAYNTRGLLDRSTDSFGDTNYAYEAAHRLASITPAVGPATTYTYGSSRGLLTGVRGATNRDYTYNDAGQITGWSPVSPTKNSASYSYDTTGRITSISTMTYGAKITYDADGRVGTVCDSIASSCSISPKLTTYGYDNAGRLTSSVTTQNGSALSSLGYNWDADSNRLSVTTDGTTITSSYDLADRITSSTDGTSYSYDDDGRTLTAGTTAYGYNTFGELSSVTTPGSSVSYSRDALARTATRTAGTAVDLFSYDGTSNNIINTKLAGGTSTTIVRGPDGTPLATVTGTGVAQQISQTLHGDLAGTNDDNSTTTGTIRYQAAYDPFGNVTSSTGSRAVPLGYQAMYTDQANGLVDIGYRSYEPRTGRFVSRDSIAGALTEPTTQNRYLYGNADPISYADLDGHTAIGMTCGLNGMTAFGQPCHDAQPSNVAAAPTPPAMADEVRDFWAGYGHSDGGAGYAGGASVGAGTKASSTGIAGSGAAIAALTGAILLGVQNHAEVLEDVRDRRAGANAHKLVMVGDGLWLYSDGSVRDKSGKIIHTSVLAMHGLFDKVKSAAGSVPENYLFLFSGMGPIGEQIAAEYAERLGGITMNDWLKLNKIDLPTYDPDDPELAELWREASRLFAEHARGVVRVVLGKNVSPGGIWATIELPALEANQNVTAILVIDPDTGEETILKRR